jgi:hypothetical protein
MLAGMLFLVEFPRFYPHTAALNFSGRNHQMRVVISLVSILVWGMNCVIDCNTVTRVKPMSETLNKLSTTNVIKLTGQGNDNFASNNRIFPVFCGFCCIP